jgi:hypothetical protein
MPHNGALDVDRNEFVLNSPPRMTNAAYTEVVWNRVSYLRLNHGT